MGQKLPQSLIPLGLAIVIAVGAFIFGLVATPPSPNLPDYGGGQAQQPGYVPGGSECQPTQTGALSAGKKAEEEAPNCADEAERHRQAEADLVQQTRAADAAQEAAKFAYYQSKVLLWGTVLGFCTLIAAGFAAFYARKAAVAAEETVLLERTAAEGRRPLLYGEVIKCNINTAPQGNGRYIWTVDIAAKVTNLGPVAAILTNRSFSVETPTSRQMRATFAAAEARVNAVLSPEPEDDVLPDSLALQPGDDWKDGQTFTMQNVGDHEHWAMVTGRDPVRVRVSVVYEDFSGNQWSRETVWKLTDINDPLKIERNIERRTRVVPA